MKPTTVVHIGSTRFHEVFELMNRLDTLDHKIVLTVGCVTQSDDTLFAGLPPEEARKIKARLDVLHLCKIDVASEVLLLNKQWYLGPSTNSVTPTTWANPFAGWKSGPCTVLRADVKGRSQNTSSIHCSACTS